MTTFEHFTFFKFDSNNSKAGRVAETAFAKMKVKLNRKRQRVFNRIW